MNILNIFKKKGSSGTKGTKRCAMCRQGIYDEETVLRIQRMALARNDFLTATNTEQRSGYRCQSCGKEYCKDCLEKHAPSNYRGGKSCPSCGGSFQIMHEFD